MHNFFFESIKKFVNLSEFNYKLIKKKALGDRVIDILFQFPISVINRCDDIEKWNNKDKLSIIVKITEHIIPRYKSSPYKILGLCKNELITINYFNSNSYFLKKLLPVNQTFLISGDAKRTPDGNIQISHPDIIDSPHTLKYHTGTEAVYPLTARLTNRIMRYVVTSLIKKMPSIPEWIPEHLMHKYNLIGFTDALRQIHTPTNINDIISLENPAKKRIAIDELLANQIKLHQMRKLYSACPSFEIKENGSLINKLNLSFKLTEDQQQCLNEIKKDLRSQKQMNRLLQGDVGSGKTIVAFISMLIVIENNMQVALLAPTEILAIQHYNTICSLSDNLGINIDIMLSSNRKIRQQQIEKLRSSETQILIGTHAILEDTIEFANLGLVVIDEQHRFGVMQRLQLIEKCQYPNVLAMSATPIPRTLLLGCYGDLDISTIKTKPADRKPIETTVISISKIDELAHRLQQTDSQIYWVCPVIEESENLIDVTTRYEYLKNIFPPNEIQILHGKMKSSEKDAIINGFKRNEFKILVSTTVIEVGIDIPNANFIVIEHAERFGLAQLHQLRGRVGRGKDASHCILLYHFPISNIGKQRLQLLKSTNDGFFISEEDLKMRGAGDILGKAQSGFDTLRFSDFSSNYELVKIADEIANSIDVNSETTQFLCNLFNRIDKNILA